MAHLKVFQPPRESNKRFRVDAGQPAVLSFKSYALRRKPGRIRSVLERARALHQNRQCPHCEHPTVEPLELEDGIRNRNNLPIPGTATLVGFHCLGCHAEWPA